MTGVLIAVVGSVALALMCGAVWSYTSTSRPVACDEEPPKYKKREYERWQRECEERNQINTQNQPNIAVQPQGLRITLGIGGEKRRAPVEGQRLLS